MYKKILFNYIYIILYIDDFIILDYIWYDLSAIFVSATVEITC